MKDRVGTGRRMRLGAALLAVVTAACAHSQGAGTQSAEEAGSGRQILVVSPMPDSPGKGTGEQIVREIVDPHTGKQWLLMRETGNPGGPGRMVLAADASGSDSASSTGAWSATEFGVSALHPVIHAGDRLIVEERTRLVEAHLEGVAMGPAAAGSALNVRLKIGGKVVRVVAIGPARAAMETATGVQP